jgi:hypothetical protein
MYAPKTCALSVLRGFAGWTPLPCSECIRALRSPGGLRWLLDHLALAGPPGSARLNAALEWLLVRYARVCAYAGEPMNWDLPMPVALRPRRALIWLGAYGMALRWLRRGVWIRSRRGGLPADIVCCPRCILHVNGTAEAPIVSVLRCAVRPGRRLTVQS